MKDFGYTVFLSRGISVQKHDGEPACSSSKPDGGGLQLRVPPGTAVKRDIDISRLFKLERPGTYFIQVARRDPSQLADTLGPGSSSLVKVYVTSARQH
jgi:hypothetical protein